MPKHDKTGHLAEQIQKATQNQQKLPPIHLWNPSFCGDIDMRIARDGTWYYLGTPITRKAMVRLFSTVLRYDADQHYYLVTPVEKLRIRVDDVPFTASLDRVEGQGEQQNIYFKTNVGDEIVADLEHPIRVVTDEKTQEPSPYLLVRTNLEALISRSAYYELVELAESKVIEGKQCLGVWSGGEFFVLGML